jgi:hypothetical protein
MTVCPNCGNDVQDRAVFCDQCGTRLKDAVAEPALPAPVEVKPVEAPVQVPDQSVRCEACGYPNAPGELFCENCGVALEALEPEAADALQHAQDDVAPKAEPEAAVPAAADTALDNGSTCPACGATVSPDDKFCDNCGAELAAAAATPETAAAQTEPSAAPAATVTGGPILIVADSGAEITLPAGDDIVVGREDPVSSIFPEIDLTPHGGEEGGVSREHAKIQVQNGNYTVQDLDSTNFTFLNRKRLAAHAPEPLQDGDELRLGRVRLVFKAG